MPSERNCPGDKHADSDNHGINRIQLVNNSSGGPDALVFSLAVPHNVRSDRYVGDTAIEDMPRPPLLGRLELAPAAQRPKHGQI